MAMVNIPSTCNDPQYRYKMPRLMSKKEGRGNGSKTCALFPILLGPVGIWHNRFGNLAR